MERVEQPTNGSLVGRGGCLGEEGGEEVGGGWERSPPTSHNDSLGVVFSCVGVGDPDRKSVV